MTAALCLCLESPWYFPCSLTRGFGQVKRTPQQIRSPEEKKNNCVRMCLLLFFGRDVAVHRSVPGAGNGHRQGTASPDIHSSCQMSRLSVRHSCHLGEKVTPCQQLEESLWGEVRVYLKKPSVMLLLACFGCRCDRIELGFHWQGVYF